MSEKTKFKMKRNCLACKHLLDDCTCDKDGEVMTKWFMNELKCCELSDSAKELEDMMNAFYELKGTSKLY